MKEAAIAVYKDLVYELTLVVGKDNITRSSDLIQQAETTTYTTNQTISLLITPRTVKQLQACIQIAHKYRKPVYTVSGGKNWGYGSRVPVIDDSILIQLTHLNRILDFDEKLGYITIEPGVTFNNAFSFLREQNSELMLSTIGGSGDASIVGNALERGIGTGLYADRFSFICGMEVLLPDGTMIATGFERYGNYKTGKLFRWGSGPSLDGLFSQSNLGIVTRMTVWLMKVPKQLSLLFYKVNNANKIPELIDELQAMIMDGLVRNTITLYNDLRVISTIMQYPFVQAHNAIIDSDVLVRLIKSSVPLINSMVGDWNGEISVRSENREHAGLQVELITKRLQNITEDIQVVHASKDDILHTFQQHHKPDGNVPPPATMQAFLLKKYIGIPDDSAVKQAYWRKRSPVPADMNPDRDKCGLIWVCPVIPFQGEDAAAVIKLIKTTVKKYSFEPAISFQCTSERCINVILSYGWDREIKGEDETAEACYFELEQMLAAQGYFSYRTTTKKMNTEHTGELLHSDYDLFLLNIKRVIDPDNIFSPGKYITSGSEPRYQ